MLGKLNAMTFRFLFLLSLSLYFRFVYIPVQLSKATSLWYIKICNACLDKLVLWLLWI